MRGLKTSAFAIALGLSSAFAIYPSVAPAQVSFDVGISVNFAPPPLPVYDQPPIPGDGYIWTPGYWTWDQGFGDFYWVPGTWVQPPEPGLLWTPAWWGWQNGVYSFNQGYWAPQVGFYGGVAYGFGYDGFGYEGGYWQSGRFFYNRSVNNITNVSVTNVYTKNVTVNETSKASFNGPGGASARPTPQQEAVAQQRHIPPSSAQVQHQRVAAADTSLRAANNKGAPAVAATARPGELQGAGVVRASRPGGDYRPPAQGQQAASAQRGSPGQPPNSSVAQDRQRPGQAERNPGDQSRADQKTDPVRQSAQSEPNRQAPGQAAPVSGYNNRPGEGAPQPGARPAAPSSSAAPDRKDGETPKKDDRRDDGDQPH